MKIKKVLIIFIASLILIICINVTLLKTYDNYIYNSYINIINSLVEKYPEAEAEIIDTVIENKPKSNILNKYGIDNNSIKNITSYQEIRIKIVLTTSMFYLIILSSVIIIYCYYTLKNKKEINSINQYLSDILKGEYNLNIADYNEDELSILKNDIYKVTIKLKELSEYEKKEQVYLMNTLEDISHQLKTPLTALMVTNDILKDSSLTKKECEEFLNKETKELEKMEWLIKTLLKYSKLDSGSVKLKKEEVKVKELMRNIIDTLSIALELKNIEIITEDLDYNLVCDKNWTKEALTNIIKNAIEHLPNEEGRITIKGENNPLYQGIIITDNGPGIKKEDIKNIFKRFYSTNTAKNSVGIGLNMAKLIIEKQNGKIEVESELKRFTTFKIIFPKNNY